MMIHWLCRSIVMMGLVLLSPEQSDSKAEDDSKIVGGFDISLNKAPFLASLQKPTIGHFCGASLVTLVSVLTGCHCLGIVKRGVKKGRVQLREWTDISVYVGSENIGEPNKLSQHRSARDVRIHPECSFEKYLVYDFGVIFVNSPFQKSPTVHPFEMASLEKRPFDLQIKNLINSNDTECFVAGWGETVPNSDRSSFLVKGTRMRIISDAECSEKMGRENIKFKGFRFADNAQMCSLSYGFRNNASDCSGDSGGPFFCEKRVYGVVSYGYDCGFWDTPNVYAKLSYFVEWYATIKHLELDIPPRSSLQITTPAILEAPSSSGCPVIVRSFSYINILLNLI